MQQNDIQMGRVYRYGDGELDFVKPVSITLDGFHCQSCTGKILYKEPGDLQEIDRDEFEALLEHPESIWTDGSQCKITPKFNIRVTPLTDTCWLWAVLDTSDDAIKGTNISTSRDRAFGSARRFRRALLAAIRTESNSAF